MCVCVCVCACLFTNNNIIIDSTLFCLSVVCACVRVCVCLYSADFVSYIYTSGTTGLPKACRITGLRYVCMCAVIHVGIVASEQQRLGMCAPVWYNSVYALCEITLTRI